jgi:hypothetical protein
MAQLQKIPGMLQHPSSLPANVEGLVRHVVRDYRALQQELRAWRWCLLVVGALHLVIGRAFDVPWGIMLLAVGGISFLACEAVWLIVYSILLLCSGLINLSSLELGWSLFGLAEIAGAVYLLRTYTHQRAAEQRYAVLTHSLDIGLPQPSHHAGTLFFWLGPGLSVLALLSSSYMIFAPATLTAHMLELLTYVPYALAVISLALCIAVWTNGRRTTLIVSSISASMVLTMLWTTIVAMNQMVALLVFLAL